MRASGSTVFNCHIPIGVQLLTRLRLCLSHLHKHKFKHRFQDSVNPICSCGNDIKTSVHFPPHCSVFSNERSTFLSIMGCIDRNILTKSGFQVTEAPLHSIYIYSIYNIYIALDKLAHNKYVMITHVCVLFSFG